MPKTNYGTGSVHVKPYITRTGKVVQATSRSSPTSLLDKYGKLKIPKPLTRSRF